MGVIDKGHTFVSGENVTADKLNNLADDATFNSDTTDNTTLEVHGTGYLKVKDAGIDTQHLANDAVTTAKITSNAVTTAKLDSGVPLVPDPGTTNNRKILTAGSTAGSFSWKHNDEEWEVTTYTNTMSESGSGAHGINILISPTFQSSTMTTYRRGRNVWITGEYVLNPNYPLLTDDHAVFMIDMPNSWKAYNTFSINVAQLTNGWHRSYTSTSNSSFVTPSTCLLYTSPSPRDS